MEFTEAILHLFLSLSRTPMVWFSIWLLYKYSWFSEGCFRRWELRFEKLLFGGHSSKALQWVRSGFCLGYLRGRSFPPKMPSFPPKNVGAKCNIVRTWSRLKNKIKYHCNINSKLSLKMHQIASQRIFISKNFRGSMPPDPPRKLMAFGHSGLLPQTINPR